MLLFISYLSSLFRFNTSDGVFCILSFAYIFKKNIKKNKFYLQHFTVESHHISIAVKTDTLTLLTEHKILNTKTYEKTITCSSLHRSIVRVV